MRTKQEIDQELTEVQARIEAHSREGEGGEAEFRQLVYKRERLLKELTYNARDPSAT